jgi:hypothetical protein
MERPAISSSVDQARIRPVPQDSGAWGAGETVKFLFTPGCISQNLERLEYRTPVIESVSAGKLPLMFSMSGPIKMILAQLGLPGIHWILRHVPA